MIEPINHTGIITSPSSHPPTTSIAVERPDLDYRRDISQTSSKYVLDKNKIVFERYDRNGKLISRVPWAANKVIAKA